MASEEELKFISWGGRICVLVLFPFIVVVAVVVVATEFVAEDFAGFPIVIEIFPMAALSKSTF